MIRTWLFAVAAALLAACPALAQVHDGIDNSPSQQRIADGFRAQGSKCDAPACHNDADGVYPPSTRPGDPAKVPSTPAGQAQPRD